jgi:hypothetical protein
MRHSFKSHISNILGDPIALQNTNSVCSNKLALFANHTHYRAGSSKPKPWFLFVPSTANALSIEFIFLTN